jgi:hypothetical protein
MRVLENVPTFYLDGTVVARMHAALQQFLPGFSLDLIQKLMGYRWVCNTLGPKIAGLFTKYH